MQTNAIDRLSTYLERLKIARNNWPQYKRVLRRDVSCDIDPALLFTRLFIISADHTAFKWVVAMSEISAKLTRLCLRLLQFFLDLEIFLY